jgi:hypothetical protein
MAGKKTEDCTTARDERVKKHKKLTPKQQHFARCVASGMSLAAGYREAYDVSPDSKMSTARDSATKLMSDPRVSQLVDKLIRDKEKAVVASAVSDREKVLSKLRTWTEADDPDQAVPATTLKAAELLGKSVGLFRDVVEDHRTRPADQVEEELQDLLGELLGEKAGEVLTDLSEEGLSSESGQVH